MTDKKVSTLCESNLQARQTSHMNFSLDGRQLLLRSSQLCVGFAESLTLGLHLTVDLVELDDVQHPRAQAGCRKRLGCNQIRLELWILGEEGSEDGELRW